MKRKNIFLTQMHFPDAPLLCLMLILLIFGIIMVYDASVVYSQTVFGGKYHFLLLQSAWVTVGLMAMLTTALVDYHYLSRFALPLLFFSIFLLVLVFVPGIGVEIYGARRWLGVGGFTLQPSELTKLALILYLGAWFSSDRYSKKRLVGESQHQLLRFLLLIGVLFVLVLAQPNLSIATILGGIGMIMYFVSGAPWKYFAIILGAFVLFGLLFIVSSPYRLSRLNTYLNPSASDPLGEGYHITQIKIALGSGGLLGKGLGQSRQKYDYLPEVCSDSIFAIVGEELGYVGAGALVVAFLVLLSRGFFIASRSPDELGMLLSVGITSWFMLQIFVNLSAMVGLVPLTGVTLPFISCGGSSAVVSMMGAGVLLNVSSQIPQHLTRS